MAKKKPQKRNHINQAINDLVTEQEVALTNKTIIELVDIKDIHELTLSNDILMHNRISYSKIKLKELAANINELAKENAGIMGTGILNPIMVRKNNVKLERIHGDNRIKALLMNKQSQAPVIILENISDELARFMRSSENLNREDLNAYDETLSIIEHIQLACDFENTNAVKSFINKVKNHKAGKTTLNEKEKNLYEEVTEIFKRIGRFDIITFVDRLSVLRLNELIKQALVDEYISYTQAKIINSKLKSDNEIKKIIEILKNKSMSKKELNEHIAQMTVKETIIQDSDIYNTVSEIRNINKLINKRNYNKLNSEDQNFIDEKLNKIKKELEEIGEKIEKLNY